jgi:hypothetical protein
MNPKIDKGEIARIIKSRCQEADHAHHDADREETLGRDDADDNKSDKTDQDGKGHDEWAIVRPLVGRRVD